MPVMRIRTGTSTKCDSAVLTSQYYSDEIYH